MKDTSIQSAPVASPCIRLCQLDAEQTCIGCGRTLAEIAAWSAADANEQRRMAGKARQRLSIMQATTMAGHR